MTNPMGVGIVATGRISDLHAIAYLRCGDARILAAWRRPGAHRPWACSRPGCSLAALRSGEARRAVRLDEGQG